MKTLIEKLEDQIQKFNDLAQQVSKNQKVGNVHDLRVATRRLRVAFWLVRKGSTFKISPDLRRALRCLGKTLGARRQLDVAMRDAARYKLDVSKLVPLQRKASFALSPLLTAKKRNKLAAGLEELRLEFSRHGELELSKPIKTLRRDLRCWVKRPKNKAELHEFRIQAKKILYVIEALGCQALPLKRYKDCLGRAHDMEVLGNYFKKAKKVRSDEAGEIKKAQSLFGPAVACAGKKLESLKKAPQRNLWVKIIIPFVRRNSYGQDFFLRSK